MFLKCQKCINVIHLLEREQMSQVDMKGISQLEKWKSNCHFFDIFYIMAKLFN